MSAIQGWRAACCFFSSSMFVESVAQLLCRALLSSVSDCSVTVGLGLEPDWKQTRLYYQTNIQALG